MTSPTLISLLEQHSHDGSLWRQGEDGRIECYACGHRCRIGEGKDGICRVRFNRGGVLRVPWGYVAALALDPVEKKPFFHALPGSAALSFGMLGCDYHCGYCQNWLTSQTLRDPEAIAPMRRITPEEIVSAALHHGAEIVTSTYNEPLITSEWSMEIFALAKREQLVTAYVSNGNGTPEVLEALAPVLDLCKVDLKGFNERRYRELGGVLGRVLETIRGLHAMKRWVEVVTLVVPGFNDGDEELRSIAGFIASVSPEIPWHVTAFHPEYRMLERDRTASEALVRAAGIGREEGLHFVYAGNIPGLGDLESTRCPRCAATLIERCGFDVRANRLRDGRCPSCGTAVPGIWKTP